MISSKKITNTLKIIGLQLFFVVVCVMALIPVLYAFSVSINSNNSLISSDFSFIPKEVTFDNYIAVFTEKPVLIWLKNSLILAVSTVVIALCISVPAAYAFSRMQFKGRDKLIKLLIMLNAFPALLSMFAMYKIMTPMGLINSRIGLIIVYTGTMSIFDLMNMKGYFDTIPDEIEDAARIDGANEFQVISKIVIPLAKPSVFVTAVMVLIYVWNEYIYAITFMTGEENYTLAAGLYSLQAGEMSGSWPVFSAASLVISLPILIIFLYVQKYMVSGLTAGGVKG
ncbi:MAG: sugar ABC transporter permease [Pseudobutyrivibrio sp.]|nr:sugar ABC transporter permease [Pseudobutyrivibrio sp.]